MKMNSKISWSLALVAATALVGCDPECPCRLSPKAEALSQEAWATSEWISVRDAAVATAKTVAHGKQRAADGTSWFATKAVNAKDLKSARWMVAGLGVFDVYVNGVRVGGDFLKPGFTHCAKTKYAFTYDVTKLMKTGSGEENALAAEVSAGWWRDKIVTPGGYDGFVGKKSAFRGVLELVYEDGSKKYVGSNVSDWTCGVAGPVTHAAIFDGEEYDARVAAPYFGEGLKAQPEVNAEFKGEVLPTAGAEIGLRCDLAMKPVEAYCWQGVEGENDAKGKEKVFGKVKKTRTFEPDGTLEIGAGETLVVDFGQNCASVPFFRFSAAEGTVLTVLPGEMLNEANGERSRGNDGPSGSIYRENLRCPAIGMRYVYTFAGKGVETYLPRFTFCGCRYVSLTATAPVTIEKFLNVPVTSILKNLELGSIETGDKDVNRLVKNVYWGQLSNYLSVTTDCPQRNERLGWTADTQVFAPAATRLADVYGFLSKWMHDMRDTQMETGSYAAIAPFSEYDEDPDRFGWADAGIIVPHVLWSRSGDTSVVRANWASMKRQMARVAETRHELMDGCFQFADWLSFERYQPCGTPREERCHPKPDCRRYWNYLGACYWLRDARLMRDMAAAIGETADAAAFAAEAERALGHIRRTYLTPQGDLDPAFADLQGANVFAIVHGLFPDAASRARGKAALLANIRAHGDCLQTGFLATSFLMEALDAVQATDVAYTLLLQRRFPSWLYSVDQGATTIWERWNSYTKQDGFGPVSMNSFNHYAYGAVAEWMFSTMAGIRPDPAAPGYRHFILAPVPDRRLGFVKARQRTPFGEIVSDWRYEGDAWRWTFTIPAGTTATVKRPGETEGRIYEAGTHSL